MNYGYGDSTWADLLTAVDGKNFTYDAIGNPTNYYNGTWWSFAWQQGRTKTATYSDSTVLPYAYTGDSQFP